MIRMPCVYENFEMLLTVLAKMYDTLSKELLLRVFLFNILFRWRILYYLVSKQCVIPMCSNWCYHIFSHKAIRYVVYRAYLKTSFQEDLQRQQNGFKRSRQNINVFMQCVLFFFVRYTLWTCNAPHHCTSQAG